jgi:aspartate-semialdehyde dehydrogenase
LTPAAGCFRECDLVFFSAGAEVSRKLVPQALSEGALVIDNTSAFRMQAEVPLVVAEVNSHTLPPKSRLIANPNCCAAILTVVLHPLHRKFRLTGLVITTLQSVSGAGRRAQQELLTQIKQAAEGQELTPSVFPHQILLNVIPQIPQSNAFNEEGVSGEERKIAQETRKILQLPQLEIAVTCVRVPVLRGHCLSVWAEFETPVDVNRVRLLLGQSPGIRVVDSPQKQQYPLPINASGTDEVLVGRIRKANDAGSALLLWIAGDNLRKGAALNALQIIKYLHRQHSCPPNRR